ncbi:MAG: hypothetical protein KA314_07875 [Chloroflexi bacterium]|nr:hypothetical protein [Chloroflexota bacterium]MBP8055747.1 hypothetical protein [Chloroflexota bacterium]
MTHQPAISVAVVQEEENYYVYVPILEVAHINDSLDEELPEIWEAVASYLESISEGTTR